MSNYSWRDKFKSRIFIPDEGKNSLEKVFLEQHEHCDVYWYKWPHDGVIFYLIEDYEPVVVIYRGKEVYCVLTRPHWKYKPYSVEYDGLAVPPEILFMSSSHDAFAKTAETSDRFEEDKKWHMSREYHPDVIKSSQIPVQYRTGLGHLSNYRISVKDPVVRAKEIYDEYCM